MNGTISATVRSLALMLWFALCSSVGRRSIIAPGGPVVSMTSHGRRVRLVFLAIESIARGTVRPARIVLWLDDPGWLAHPPRTLRRLVARGLEIRRGDALGPHTKYFPYAASEARHRVAAVTADDDWLLPRHWLEELLRASLRAPGCVVAHRAHLIRIGPGGIAPYSDWAPATDPAPSPLHFGTGCLGQLLPPPLLDRLRDEGLAFQQCTPRNDDVWIHRTALELGLEVRPVLTVPERAFVPIRGGGLGRRGVAPLFESNVGGGANDAQIAATYGPSALAALRAAY